MTDGQHTVRRRALAVAVPIAVLGFIASAALYAYFKRAASPADLEVYGSLPEFELRDQTGAAVTRSDLAGHVVIANFIFTRCPTVCPTFTMKMKRVADRLSGSSVRLLSFSVDPDYDQPEVLARFAAKFGADAKQWRFLTGDPSTIKERVVAGLAMALDQRGTLSNGAPDIVHSTHFILIDGRHRIRGYYNSDTPERIDRLIRDARSLAR